MAIVPEARGGRSIVVVANSRLVYRKRVQEILNPQNGQTYDLSGNFINANDAPSRLMLQTYTEAGLLKGEFSEVTYLPVLAAEIQGISWGMACRYRGQVGWR